MYLFIDDERHPPDNWKKSYFVARSVSEAAEFMEKFGCPVHISFDHDLGENQLTGFDLTKWMIEKDMDCGGKWFPIGFSYTVHSMNPVGEANIVGLMTPYLMKR